MRISWSTGVLALALVLAACTPTDSVDTTTTTDTTPSFAGTIPAPAFPTGLDWINTAEPLTLNELKGKVVVLDFWTYGCINCIHVIPDLHKLEEEFENELVVIGVHSAKFDNESETENLVDIVQRYGLEHPVVNDKDFAIWNEWGANAWPTTAVIDPAGNAVGIRSGEGVYEALQPVIQALVDEFDQSQSIDRTPIELALEATTAPATPLRYPGKVLATNGRLFVADTGHHRIVELDPTTGDALAAFGSGSRGFDDGNALEASFDSPQGMTLNPDTDQLYVADVGNHAIRSINLATGEVTTLVGDGDLGWPPIGGALSDVHLNSPWDVLYSDGFIYVANAGSHQLWAIDLARETATPLVGSAREGTVNGPFPQAELAQPSGLALSERGELFFADSESSSVRVALLLSGRTELVVGGDANLFVFGDVDGMGNLARLQHPLGLALNESILYVADTYNSKIKRIDIEDGGVTSWLGSESGWSDGTQPQFNEPGGLSFDDGMLWVADTNNHAVRSINPETGEARTLVVKGIEAFDPVSEYAGPVTEIEGSISAAAGPGTLTLAYQLPPGHKVNEDAPSTVTVSGSTVAISGSGDITGTALPVSIPVEFLEGQGPAFVDVNLVYCAEEAESLCYIDRMRFALTLNVGPSGPSSQVTLGREISR